MTSAFGQDRWCVVRGRHDARGAVDGGDAEERGGAGVNPAAKRGEQLLQADIGDLDAV